MTLFSTMTMFRAWRTSFVRFLTRCESQHRQCKSWVAKTFQPRWAKSSAVARPRQVELPVMKPGLGLRPELSRTTRAIDSRPFRLVLRYKPANPGGHQPCAAPSTLRFRRAGWLWRRSPSTRPSRWVTRASSLAAIAIRNCALVLAACEMRAILAVFHEAASVERRDGANAIGHRG